MNRPATICQARAVRFAAPAFVSSDLYRRPAYGRNHPLAIPRVEIAVDLCRRLGWLEDELAESPTADIATLTRFHDPAYVAALHEADVSGHVSIAMRQRYNLGTLENPVFPGVFARAATAVGGSILAAQKALEGRIAYHPAGGTHHAKRGAASGFCYFNDPVFAILTLLDAGLGRVSSMSISTPIMATAWKMPSPPTAGFSPFRSMRPGAGRTPEQSAIGGMAAPATCPCRRA